MKSKNICLFGGAFDPPHLGHTRVAQALIDQQLVDEVWFVPVFDHPWAAKFGKFNMTDYDLRVEMLELVLEDEKKFGLKIAHFKDVSYTYPTFQYFESNFPEYNFSWVMGSEYIEKFDSFLQEHPQLADYQFYIYPRAGFPIDQDKLKSNMVVLEDVLEIKLSSGMVRERVKHNKSIGDLVSGKVAKYIKKKRIY